MLLYSSTLWSVCVSCSCLRRVLPAGTRNTRPSVSAWPSMLSLAPLGLVSSSIESWNHTSSPVSLSFCMSRVKLAVPPEGTSVA